MAGVAPIPPISIPPQPTKGGRPLKPSEAAVCTAFAHCCPQGHTVTGYVGGGTWFRLLGRLPQPYVVDLLRQAGGIGFRRAVSGMHGEGRFDLSGLLDILDAVGRASPRRVPVRGSCMG